MHFYEELHAPLLHVFTSLPMGAGVEAPVVVAPTGLWFGKMPLIIAIDAHSPAGRKVFGETEAERQANQAFLQAIVPPLSLIGRFVYHQVLPHKTLMYPVVSYGAPAWERALLWMAYPIWRFALSKGFGDAPSEIAAAPTSIEAGMDLIEQELQRRGGTPFLSGQSAGGIDVVVAGLLSPVIFPANYGGKLPNLADTPETLRDFVARARARPAGRLALATYETAR